ncbi:MAG: hypothetical protein M4D80_33905 [Myxococcota bacterium]|nr:hypothetical protein [Myxococcota bacterium]
MPSTVFISDYRANAIFRYDGATGEFLGTFAQGSEQRVDRPAGVRLGPNDQLYSAGFGRGEVIRYDVHSGQMMDVFYWDTTLLEEPVELVFDGQELVVLGNDTNNLVVLAPDGTLARTFGYPHMRGAHDFVIDRGRVLVATEPAVQIWDLASGTQLGEIGRGDLVLATSIAIHEDTIYVADWDRDAILAYPGGRVIAYGLRDPISIDFFDGALYVLDATGLNRLDAETGEHLSQLVARDDRLIWPRSFTFVRD